MEVPIINNRKNFLFQNHPSLHPQSIKYIEYWRFVKRAIIEGYWGQDTVIEGDKGSWRFMPPQLFFYVNCCYILHKEENAAKTAPRKKVHPNLDDIDFDFFYKYLEARGFSGFRDDEEFTCCRDVELFNKGKISEIDIPISAYNKKHKLKKYVPARQYIMQLHDKPLGIPIYDNDAKNMVLLGSRGAGKELADYEPVITANGEKCIGDVIVGDRIYDESGTLTSIKAVYPQGVKPIYKITLTDGREVDAGLEHLWEVYEYNKQKRVYTTQELIARGLNYPHKRSGVTYRFYLPENAPVQFEEKPLPIPPYVLGALLGDGTMNANAIKVASDDDDIINRFRELLPDYKLNKDSSNNNYYIAYKYKGGKGNWVNPLRQEIIKLGVNKKCEDKFIPEIYKYSSIEQRLELIRGLLDTDGSINKDGSIEFCNKNKKLLEDLAYVVRSLGIRCQIGEEHREEQLHTTPTGHISPRNQIYRLFIRTDLPVFFLPRKLDRIKKRKNTSRVAIKSIEYLKENSATCIEVDNKSHLFLTRNFVTTHNSYWVADGCVLHEIIIDGAKEYTEDSIKNPAKVEVFVGAAIASKSSEMLEKTLMGIQNLPGAWKPGTSEEIPSPLYKRTTGSLTQPSKIPWISRYEEKIGGEWKWQGSLSSVRHGIWTIENPEAAAGGRYNLVVCEEFGLLPNSITVHMSNIPTMFIEHKFGTALYLGTGGNIEKIHQSQAIFSDPEGFDALEFDDIWENTGKIGYFIPATYSNRKFKDANGNTKVAEATEYYFNVREKKRKSKTGSALDMEMMNYPLVPSEMFLSKAHNKFPIADLKHSLSELLTSKLLDASWKGEFIINGEGKITWKNLDRNPIREFPVRDIANIEGCWEIFQMPVFVNDSIPFGRYGASLDPVDDDDNADKSRSLQSCFIIDFFTDTIVAEYTGRTQFAKDFYEQVRRAMVYYNCRLLYENNKKGVFAYFDQKNSLHLLEDTPEMLKDMDMQKLVAVGNKSKGVYMNEALINFGVDLYSQWLMSQANGKIEGVTNAHVLRSVGLIRESLVWSKDINADRVSSIIILMILRETKIKQIESRQKAVNKPSLNKDEFWMKHYNTRNQQRMMHGAMNSYTDSRVFNNNN